MMPRPRNSSKGMVRAVHIKYASISIQTVKHYRAAVAAFFKWIRNSGQDWPNSPDELDLVLSEYINSLYRRREALYRASYFVSGFRRLVPQVP